MRAIVYDVDTAEPITVLSMRRSWLTYLDEHGLIEIAFVPAISPDDKPAGMVSVELKLQWGYTPKGVKFPMLFTESSELALQLDSAMLAGQNDLLQQAFEDGIGHALLAL